MLDEPYQRLLADIVRVLSREHLDPGARVGRVLPGPDLRERAVEHEIAGGSPVGDHQGLQVGVDPVGEGEVHQNGAGQRAFDTGARNRYEGSVRVFQQQDQHLFGEGKHGSVQWLRHRRLMRWSNAGRWPLNGGC